jgi:hypothetical protein
LNEEKIAKQFGVAQMVVTHYLSGMVATKESPAFGTKKERFFNRSFFIHQRKQ